MNHCYSLDIQCVYWQLLAQITVFEQDLKNKNKNLQRHHYTLIQMCGRISHVALKVVSFCTSLESTFDRNILIALFSWWQFCISYWEKSSNSGNTEPSVFNNIMRHSLRTGNHSWFCRICLLYKCWLGFYQFFFFFILEKEREREICMSRNIKYLKIKKSWRKIDTSLLYLVASKPGSSEPWENHHLLMSALQIYISPAKICVMQALRMGYATTLALQRKHNSSQKLWDKIVWSVWLFITRIMKFHGCHMTGCNFYDFILTWKQ